MKFNNLGIFRSLELRILVEENPPNFSKAKFHSKYFGLLWVNLRIFKSFKFLILMGKPNFSQAKFHSKYFELLWVNLGTFKRLKF